MSENDLAKKGWFLDRTTMRTWRNQDGRIIERSDKDGHWYLSAQKKAVKLYRSLADSVAKADQIKAGRVKA